MKHFLLILLLCLGLTLGGCHDTEVKQTASNESPLQEGTYQLETPIQDVMTDLRFEDYGRLLFPINSRYYSGRTLEDLQLVFYDHIDPNETVAIANNLARRVDEGQTVFYDIYTPEQKAEDPTKENTGLFFFKGNAGAPFALCSAGGGFVYVGAMQDSFPHAYELSQRGYHAFALIYRPGQQTACEDLAAALGFIFDHADELEVDVSGYSLWGGSAGARMSALLGSYGPQAFGGADLPRPAAVVMQYTGHTDYTENDSPTFACVGEQDGIASWQVMAQRIDNLNRLGIPTEFHHYPGLGHGFGLGTGTIAEGWIDQAISFWENNR